MRRAFLDTNVILRYLLWDDPAKAVECQKLLERAAHGKEVLVTTALVVAEVVWVLEKFYKQSRALITEAVCRILGVAHIEVEDKDVLMAAAGLYELKNIDFIDAYNALYAQAAGIGLVYSYDTDFDRIVDLKRLEPGKAL